MLKIIINILLFLVFSSNAFAKIDEIKSNNTHYIGDVSTIGKANGDGMITWLKNPGKGDKFYGLFKNGNKVSGVYYYANGAKLAGLYKNDLPSLSGYTYENGDQLYGYTDTKSKDVLKYVGCGIYIVKQPYSFSSVCMYNGKWKETPLSAYEKKQANNNYKEALRVEIAAEANETNALKKVALFENKISLRNETGKYICTKATTMDGKWESYDSQYGNYRKEANRRGLNLNDCNSLTGRGAKSKVQEEPPSSTIITASSVDTLCAAVGGCWRNGQVRKEFKEYLSSNKLYKALAFDREKILNRPPHAGATSSVSQLKAETAALKACENLTKNKCVIVMRKNKVVHIQLKNKVNEIRNGTYTPPEIPEPSKEDNTAVLIIIGLAILGFVIFVALSKNKKATIKSQRLDSLGPVKRKQQDIMDFEIISKSKNKQSKSKQNQQIDQQPIEDDNPKTREKLEKATIKVDSGVTKICNNCESENSSDKLICIVCGQGLT